MDVSNYREENKSEDYKDCVVAFVNSLLLNFLLEIGLLFLLFSWGFVFETWAHWINSCVVYHSLREIVLDSLLRENSLWKYIGVLNDLSHDLIVISGPFKFLLDIRHIRSHRNIIHPRNKSIVIPLIVLGCGFDEHWLWRHYPLRPFPCGSLAVNGDEILILQSLRVPSKPIKHIFRILGIVEKGEETNNPWVLECSLHPSDSFVLVAALRILFSNELIHSGVVNFLNFFMAFNAWFDNAVNISSVVTLLNNLIEAFQHCIFVFAKNTILTNFLSD